jgi:hypothetical protein
MHFAVSIQQKMKKPNLAYALPEAVPDGGRAPLTWLSIIGGVHR